MTLDHHPNHDHNPDKLVRRWYRAIYASFAITAVACLVFAVGIATGEIRQPTASTTALCYTVTNATAVRIAEAFAWAHNYQPTIGGAANPETRAQFTDRMIAEHIRQTVRRYELVVAREAAEAAEAAKPPITVQ